MLDEGLVSYVKYLRKATPITSVVLWFYLELYNNTELLNILETHLYHVKTVLLMNLLLVYYEKVMQAHFYCFPGLYSNPNF